MATNTTTQTQTTNQQTQSTTPANSSNKSEPKKSFWMQIAEKARDWLNNFIEKHGGKSSEKSDNQSTISNVDDYVHTMKDDTLLGKQYREIDSTGIMNNFDDDYINGYIRKYLDALDDKGNVSSERFKNLTISDGLMRFLIKDGSSEYDRNWEFNGFDNVSRRVSPEFFTNPEAASKYYDDLSNLAVNSGLAGALLKANDNPEYADTDEYAAIMENYNTRYTAIKEAYRQQYPDIDFEKELTQAMDSTITKLADMGGVDVIEAALSDATTVDGKSLAKSDDLSDAFHLSSSEYEKKTKEFSHSDNHDTYHTTKDVQRTGIDIDYGSSQPDNTGYGLE